MDNGNLPFLMSELTVPNGHSCFCLGFPESKAWSRTWVQLVYLRGWWMLDACPSGVKGWFAICWECCSWEMSHISQPSCDGLGWKELPSSRPHPLWVASHPRTDGKQDPKLWPLVPLSDNWEVSSQPHGSSHISGVHRLLCAFPSTRCSFLEPL